MAAGDQFPLSPSVTSFLHQPPILGSSSSSCSNSLAAFERLLLYFVTMTTLGAAEQTEDGAAITSRKQEELSKKMDAGKGDEMDDQVTHPVHHQRVFFICDPFLLFVIHT